MKNNKNFKNKQRCIYSNKITDGKEVIIKDYALDFITKEAFIDVMIQTKNE